MVLLLNTVFLFLLFLITYSIVTLLSHYKINDKVSNYINRRNEKYYKDVEKYYNKSKKIKLKTKISIIYRLNILIDKAGLKRGLIVNPWTIILISLLVFYIAYIISFKLFGTAILSAIVSLPLLFAPALLLNVLKNINSTKLERIMLDFLLQLKNYTKINNDIVFAFKEVKTLEPLQSYINTFLIQINSGIKFEKAIENIKEKIEFETLKSVFTNIEYCYIYGGNFSELMDKSYQKIYKIQKEKLKRISETKSSRIVLGILIALDLIVYFNYIKNNYDNYIIMSKTIFGNMILYWNFISIWILLLLMNKVKKLDY